MYEKNQQTTLRISAQQLTLNFYGFTLVSIQTTPQPSPSVNPESDSGSSSPAATNESQCFKHITQKCINEQRVDAVNAEISAACKGTAEGLWRTLWNNENLGYVVVEPIDATTLYKDIEQFYGKLPYTERNFRHARNKR